MLILIYTNLLYISLTLGTNSSEDHIPDTDIWILLAVPKSSSIDKLDMGTMKIETLVSDIWYPLGLDFHFYTHQIYWADFRTKTMGRADMTNPDNTKENIVTDSIGSISDIAVDWIYDHLYWIDKDKGQIMVSELDGRLRKTLVNTDLRSGRAMVVDPNSGWMYFTNTDGKAKIEKCGMDGSERQVIVTAGIKRPVGLSIDFSAKRLYWIDRGLYDIKSSNLDGTDIQLLAHSMDHIKYSVGMVVLGEWVYWATRLLVRRVDKMSGSMFEIIGTSESYEMKVYSKDRQPSGTNLCSTNNGGCEQLCLPTPRLDVRCDCADGFQLNGSSCINIASDEWLIYGNVLSVEKINLNTMVTETITRGFKDIEDVDVCYSKGFVFWADPIAQNIMSLNMTNGGQTFKTNTADDIIDKPSSIAVDCIYDLLYWVDKKKHHIMVSRLDGTDRRTIYNDYHESTNNPLVVDSNVGFLFYTFYNHTADNSKILRNRMDGTDPTVIYNNAKWIAGMTVDSNTKRLYWVDAYLFHVKTIRYNGEDAITVVGRDDGVFPLSLSDVAVHNTAVYFIQYRTIYKFDRNTTEGPTEVSRYLRDAKGLQIFADGVQLKGENICGQDNGGCSHICFPVPESYDVPSTTSECMCPDYFWMADDNKTCYKIEKPENLQMQLDSNTITVKWELPQSTGHLHRINMQIYDHIADIRLANKTVNGRLTSYTITVVSQQCSPHSFKVRCEYKDRGWSDFTKQVFWFPENTVYAIINSSLNVSWTYSFDYPHHVNFTSGENEITIFSDENTRDSSRYSDLLQENNEIQFLLRNVTKFDAGLYKSVGTLSSNSVDGCVLLVVIENNLRPNLTYDTVPFVGDPVSFTCELDFDLWPSFLYITPQYKWSVRENIQQNTFIIIPVAMSDKGKTVGGNIQQNTLIIDPVAMSDKGKTVYCSVNVDNMNIADVSNEILLDPYFGPRHINLSTDGTIIRATTGLPFRPIICAAECYPMCNFTWKLTIDYKYNIIMVGPNLTIEAPQINDSGVYTCFIVHQYDNSRVISASIELVFNDVAMEAETDNNKLFVAYSSGGTALLLIIVIVTACVVMRCKRRQKSHDPKSTNEDQVRDLTTSGL